MNRNDFDGDGSADLLVTSPWGVGVLSVKGGSMVQRAISQNGSRLGEWLLNTGDNVVAARADMDGDGVGELLLASPWGIGLVKLGGGSLRSVAMAQNGRRVGGWIIDTTNNQFLHAGDVDGDGRDEVLVISPWGIGLLHYRADFGSLMLSPNGTRFGGWLLNTGDNAFPCVADVDGDGRPELVVTSPWGLGILKYSGSGLTSICMVPNGTAVGGWILDTAMDRVEVAVDLDGDGRAEMVLGNGTGIVVLRWDHGALQGVAAAKHGDRLGSWTMDAARDRFGAAGDFDGDGRAELLVGGKDGIGLLSLSGGRIASRMVAPNGTRFGGWLLNTRDNRLNHVADFDGDRRTELLITSPWGAGILKFNGTTFDSVALCPNGTRFGGWLLNTADNDLEAGLGRSWALLIWHGDWTGAVTNTADFLRKRGFSVVTTQDAGMGLRELRRLALNVRAGDRVFVYLAGHGATGRGLTDRQRSSALLHILQFGDGSIVGYDQFEPAFRRMGVVGADLIVFDGSCDGGEAVMAALGERYLALSTTGIHAPGITNTPDPSNIMSRAGRPNSFGLWWSAELTASLMTSQTPHRFYQKIYRSDATEINELSLFYKPGITYYQAVGDGWNLSVRGCYLYRYVYPADFNAMPQDQKDALTVGTEPYLASVRADLQAMLPPITRLLEILRDGPRISRAADVYAGAFPKPWCALLGDLTWDVHADPVRKSFNGTDLEPRSYAGRSGFLRMVDDIQKTLALFAQSYEEQERLLRELDGAVFRRNLVRGVSIQARSWLPSKVTDYQAFNAFDLRFRPQLQRLADETAVPQRAIYEKLHAVPVQELKSVRFTQLLDKEWSAVQTRAPIAALHPGIDEIVARIHAIQASNFRLLDHLFFILTIVEEAVSCASAGGAETGDLLSY